MARRTYTPSGPRGGAEPEPGSDPRLDAKLDATFGPLGPRYPAGTPEYTAYATELRTELAEFAAGEAPYEYAPSATPCTCGRRPGGTHRRTCALIVAEQRGVKVGT